MYGSKLLQGTFVNYEGLAKVATEDHGAGKDAIVDAAKSGIFSKEFYSSQTPKGGEPYGDLVYHYGGTGLSLKPEYLFDKYTGTAKPTDAYGKALKEMYADVLGEMRESGEYAQWFKYVDDPKYKGTYYYNSDLNVLISIASCIIIDRMNEIQGIANKECKDSNTFTYNGETLDCELIADDSKAEDYYGINITKDFAKNQILAPSVSRAEDGYVASDVSRRGDYIEKFKQKADKHVPSDYVDSSSGQGSSCNESEGLFCFGNSDTGYYPSIKNVVKNSQKLEGAGTLKSDGKEFSETMNELIKQIIDIIGKFGRYIMYTAILFFGVKAIFDGARGQAQFKETLPYLLVAIIFFYSAPKLVDIFQKEIFNTSDYNKIIDGVFGSLIYIVRVLAFCGIIFAGIKMMFGNFEQKADAKKTFLPLIVGCIFVFASSVVVDITVSSLYEASNTKKKIEFINVNGNYNSKYLAQD